ncbi:MAG: hypothetical protein RBU30_16605 [Polyangia bacterium]|jgi:hypothetical protein|nr:hypothetical protein [Polyangia bacterium]
MRGAIAIIAPGLFFAGCLFPSDRDSFGDQHPPPLVPLATSPRSGEERVSRNQTIRFFFDGRVHPDSLGTQTLALTTGSSVIRCSRRVDLLDCSADLLPQDTLRPSLLYRAIARDLRSVAGGAQSEPVELLFVTGDATSTAPAAPAPELGLLVAEVFAPRCASCHSGYQPPSGLDLSTEAAARETLLGRESLYQPGVRLVSPGRHAASYLLWKLLALPGIWGDPMPPRTASSWPTDRSCGTLDQDLRRIAAWVDGL